MRIVVAFALDWEFKPWLRLRSFRQAPGSQRLFQTRMAESDVSVILTGVGPLNSVRSIRAALDEAPDLCIATGLAGGLKRAHPPAEVLAARAVRSESGPAELESDGTLLDMAVECGAKAVNRFISTGHIVRTAKGKTELGASADAVDMESFAIMKEMSRLGVPCVAVRSISDSAETDVPCDFERALDDSGRLRIMQVLGQVVSDPRQALPMARFGARSSRAAASLARYLDQYTAYLAEHKERVDLRVQQISQ